MFQQQVNGREAAKPALSNEDRGRIVARIAKDHQVDHDKAISILMATEAFLKMAATHPDRRFVPSEEVDKGWHTFLLYTGAYRRFCASLGPRFIDHEPNDGAVVECGGYARTLRFMEEQGIAYDGTHWPTHALGADCVPDPCTCTGEISASMRGVDCTNDLCDAGSCFPVDDK